MGCRIDGQFGLGVEMLAQNGPAAGVMKRQAASYHLIEQNAERIQVGAMVDIAPADNFWSDIIRGTTGLDLQRNACLADQPKIHQFDDAFWSYAYIAGFYIKMDKASGM